MLTGRQRAHVQDGPHASAPAPDGPLAAQAATIAPKGAGGPPGRPLGLGPGVSFAILGQQGVETTAHPVVAAQWFVPGPPSSLAHRAGAAGVSGGSFDAPLQLPMCSRSRRGPGSGAPPIAPAVSISTPAAGAAHQRPQFWAAAQQRMHRGWDARRTGPAPGHPADGASRAAPPRGRSRAPWRGLTTNRSATQREPGGHHTWPGRQFHHDAGGRASDELLDSPGRSCLDRWPGARGGPGAAPPCHPGTHCDIDAHRRARG